MKLERVNESTVRSETLEGQQTSGYRAERLFNVPLLHTEGTCVTGDHPLQLGRHFRNIFSAIQNMLMLDSKNNRVLFTCLTSY